MFYDSDFYFSILEYIRDYCLSVGFHLRLKKGLKQSFKNLSVIKSKIKTETL